MDHSADNYLARATTVFQGEVFQAAAKEKDRRTIGQYTFAQPKSMNNPSFQPEDFFLSHRGPDTKLDLVVPLSQMMSNLYGHSFFVDCEPTNMLAKAQATSIKDVIAQSIWTCKVIVVFISHTFHESEWCLKELYTALYRGEVDPSLEAVHIIYCDGILKTCKGMPQYSCLHLGNKWGTEFKEGVSLHEFASNQLHKVLYQLIHGNEDGILSNKESLAEWRKVCRHRWGIPPKLKYFVGRQDKLLEISKILQHHPSAAITTHGVGGVGKSQLVVSWVQENLPKYQLAVWINSEQATTLQQDLARFGEQLGLKYSDEESLEQKARRVMAVIQGRSSPQSPSLIIFDNANSYREMLDQDSIPPPGSHCHSTVTTRDSAGCNQDEQIVVGPLDERSSLAIVEHFLKRELCAVETPQVLKMLQSYNLGNILNSVGECLADTIRKGFDEAGQHDHPFVSPFLPHAQVLVGHDWPDDSETLGNLAFWLGRVLDNEAQYEKVQKCYQKTLDIREKGLCKDRPDYAQTLHNMANVHNNQGQYDEAMKCYQQAFDIREKALGKDHRDYAQTLNNMANVHYNQANYDDALKLYQKALEIQGHALGKDHPLYAQTLHNIAIVHDGQGQYETALQLYQQALEIRGSSLGKDHPDYAATLNNMASVHGNQGQYDQAMKLYEQGLEIKGKALGKDHPDYATILNNMASVHDAQGQYEQALQLYQQALEIRGEALGKGHPSYADTLYNMTVDYCHQDFLMWHCNSSNKLMTS